MAFGIVCKQQFYKRGSSMKVGCLQSRKCLRQVQEVAAGCFRENAESSDYRSPAICSFASAIQIIDNQPIGVDRFREQNRIPFPSVQKIQQRVGLVDDATDSQPCGGS